MGVHAGGREGMSQEDESKGGSWLSQAVKEVGGSLLPVLLTAGGFIGFVAVAGGAIVWTRLRAAHLPADQAIAALPQGELVAIGAVSLSLFGVLGAIAAVGIYLVDRGGRPTPGMSRGLLWLVLLEGLVVIVLVEGGKWQRDVVAAEVLALLVVIALIVTRMPAFV